MRHAMALTLTIPWLGPRWADATLLPTASARAGWGPGCSTSRHCLTPWVASVECCNRLLPGRRLEARRAFGLAGKPSSRQANSLGDVSAAHRRAHRRSGDSGSATNRSLSKRPRSEHTR